MKVGFIGLGQMGSNMAANLIKAGNEVVVYNRSRDKMQLLADKGAHAAVTLADACRADAVITMLSDDRALEGYTFGLDGIIQNLSKDSVHISMSTISVFLAKKLASEHAHAGQHFVSAPVFGRPEAAAAGKLFIIAAGEKHSVDHCMPLFESMGQRTFYIGEKHQDANLIKLTGNFMIASVIESLGEAMAFVGKAGIDTKQFLDVLTSSLFSAPVYQTYGKQIVERKYKPAGFAAPLAQKDIGLIISAAESMKVPLPLASLLHDRLLRLLAQNDDAIDWSAIGDLAAKDSGL